ncbi:MAG: TonB-dependent receptor [Chlorobi bacterium]|nr:TonB-dependent receptor [Chlorobiota bacterium]
MKKLFIFLVSQVIFVSAFAQFTITGQVIDENNNALAGANIQIGNTYLGTYADINGKFILKNLKMGTYEISVSFLGYKVQKRTIDVQKDMEISIKLEKSPFLTDEVIVSSTRAGNKAPLTYSNISKEQIEDKNYGQDIPYLLNTTPSLVTTSDAGTGIGYTNFRIRGTDINRINVTLNGIPMNDAESHGVWWVDLPDFAESVDNIQIQRGVGTSTNGAASFGATINLQTTTLNKKPYTKFSTNAGSFNTFKNSLSVGSGLINKHYTFDARFSKVNSDGYIDRARVDLKSFFVSGGYYSEKSILKINIFSGVEETYQAWTGVPSVRLNTDSVGMRKYLDHYLYSEKEYENMINSNNRTYNFYTYDNEIDHYQQDNYQLLFSHKVNSDLNVNAALHYTKGKGYYEQYKEGESFANYGLDNLIIGTDTLEKTDLIRRKWLDNDFYGVTYSAIYKKLKFSSVTGGAINQYEGNHFGRIIWAKYASNSNIRYEWYRNYGNKWEFNIFEKIGYSFSNRLNLLADIQYRRIDYKISGFDDDNRNLGQTHIYNFLNPKVGFYYSLQENQDLHLYFGIANREPSRSNLVDADPAKSLPVSEKLFDYEMGYNYKLKQLDIGLNFYYMYYQNQLVLTGEINDVGDPIMTNVPKSFRKGIEITARAQLIDKILWNGNLTLSSNKILNFTENVDNWDYWSNPTLPYQYTFNLGKTDLSFSPAVVFNNEIIYSPTSNFSVSLISNYVGKQYIDNSADNNRILNAYFVNNCKLNFKIKSVKAGDISIHLLVNNIFNTMYESNAWVYRYYYNNKPEKMDGYFPQAGINFIGGLTIKLH